MIDYAPADWLIESKSLKLYLAAFRSHGAFHEDCTLAIGAKIVEAAARFQSEITILKDGQRVNARSIMGLMMLAASQGSEIGLEAEGPDAPEAMTAMLALIEAKFGEE